MMHFSNDWWILIQIHQYYTMALKTLFNIVEDQFDFFFFTFISVFYNDVQKGQ